MMILNSLVAGFVTLAMNPEYTVSIYSGTSNKAKIVVTVDKPTQSAEYTFYEKLPENSEERMKLIEKIVKEVEK